jgi:hypothetical protein
VARHGASGFLFASAMVGSLYYATPASYAGFGAIAFSPSDGAIGYSYGYPPREAAEGRAFDECLKNSSGDCRIVIWERNACAALAAGENNGWGVAWHPNRSAAELRALALCSENTSKCEGRRWVCN